jgi:diaminopimelate decarboxylase
MIPKPLLEPHPTPFYIYDLTLLEQTLQACKKAANAYNFHVHYALKANVNQPILNRIRDLGFGADCVSGNEVLCAKETGFDTQKIVFAGVGKTDEEIATALDLGLFCFNCESIQELEVINEIAEKKQIRAQVALRINPNVNAKTHKYITTGLDENKFGINAWELDQVLETCATLKHIQIIGIHFHIGSQIVDLNVFRQLCIKVNEFLEFFQSRKIPLQIINVGGGLGIDYEHPDTNPIPDFAAFFEVFDQNLNRQPHQQVHFELGRSLVGQCGYLVTQVLYIKEGIKTNFAIVDAGMTELLRPALYQSYHKIENISATHRPIRLYDVVGPICESSDCFGKAVSLPETKRGDLIAIRSVGAYGEVMSSGYNLRTKAKDYYFYKN